ncbi:hypothetical protein CFC21_003222 [Triticum aestivum]|uniref:Uncharacterized protein n=1 Tax=Triticum aestivum TaxID=4565 RepID=A0A3B5Y3J5_WHEAT|nr:hypothetical protein CFC21_003222 [Triticum aestivum]
MNSVAASATRPSIAKRPFQSSASALQIPLDLLSTVWPCSSGTNDAAENTPAMRSGAGPLKASVSQTEGFAFLVMGLGAAGIGVGLVLGEEEVDALVVSLVESMPGCTYTNNLTLRSSLQLANMRCSQVCDVKAHLRLGPDDEGPPARARHWRAGGGPADDGEGTQSHHGRHYSRHEEN